MFAGDRNLNLEHYHTVSFSGGQFTIGGTTGTAPGPFDVTATTWYKNQIAAAKLAGWNGALGTVRITNNKTGAGDDTINLPPGGTVTVYAQAKVSDSQISYNTYGTVTVNAGTYSYAGNRYWGYSTDGGATWNHYYSGAMYYN